MKNQNDDHNQLPDSALRAFENYPQITASPDFNRRVLERVLVARPPSRLELLCDRLDEIFARPVLKLLGAASMGAVVALIGVGALMAASGVSAPSAPDKSPVTMAERDPEAIIADSLFLHNRLAWARDGKNSFEMPHDYIAPQQQEFQAPVRREKTSEENTDNRSSSCPAASRSQV